uniref:Ig-like domain-containing protein n=1 Tax=Lates calcarifer TaxID=8187 RepID=A0A4W6D5K9_LATCA
MRSFTLIPALLLCSWISVSVSESQTVEVQSGENVTLLCSNTSTAPTHTFWSKLYNKTKISCISSMYGSEGEASFCDGFQNGKYEMSSNITTISLKIKQVDVSDSGLYLCGFYMSRHTRLTVTDLNVQGAEEFNLMIFLVEEPDGIAKLTSMILGAVTVFLVMVVIGLTVKTGTFQTADENQNPQRNKVKWPTSYLQNLDSGDLKDAALSLYSPTIRNRRPASEREEETHVIYTASR